MATNIEQKKLKKTEVTAMGHWYGSLRSSRSPLMIAARCRSSGPSCASLSRGWAFGSLRSARLLTT